MLRYTQKRSTLANAFQASAGNNRDAQAKRPVQNKPASRGASSSAGNSAMGDALAAAFGKKS